MCFGEALGFVFFESLFCKLLNSLRASHICERVDPTGTSYMEREQSQKDQ